MVAAPVGIGAAVTYAPAVGAAIAEGSLNLAARGYISAVRGRYLVNGVYNETLTKVAVPIISAAIKYFPSSIVNSKTASNLFNSLVPAIYTPNRDILKDAYQLYKIISRTLR